jgi:hypothetical protein
LGDAIEATRFEGSEDGSYEYELDLPVLGDIPSNNEADLDHFAVPTDQDLLARNTTRAAFASKDKSCECCGMKSAKLAANGKKVHAVKCSQCKTSMKVCDKCIEADADCKHCKTAEMKEEEDIEGEVTAQTDVSTNDAISAAGKGATLVKQVNDGAAKATDQLAEGLTANINNARIKAAYSCATKLALAGIINSDECDSYADQLLEDGLRADVMIKNTQLLLRSAQASAERVASAAAQKLNTRTASAMSISTSPALSGSSNSAALDIQSALKGTWTMPKIED